MSAAEDSHVLYRMHDHDGDLLYVGITCRPPTRFKDHRNTKDWWSEVATIGVTTLASRAELLAMERQAIRTEAPRYNVVHNRRLAASDLRSLTTSDLPTGIRTQLLIVQEVADMLGVNRATVYRLFAAGELAWVQIGARRRVTAAEVDRFIAAHIEASA